MRHEKIGCENSSNERLWATYKERLLGDLKGEVFHLTSQLAFNLIQDSEAIEHNKDGNFKLNTGSEKSFGRQNGWVCFFDFRNAGSEIITDTLENRYDFLRPRGDFRRKPSEDWAEYSLAYLILGSRYYDRLIPYERFKEHESDTGQYPMAVPKVEAWILYRVPIIWIEKVILANIGESVTAHEINVSQIHDNLTF